MFGDFSRRTFDPAAGNRAVLLQQGRVVLDADLNEQADITAYQDVARTRDLIGPHGGPAGQPGPFAVVGGDQPWADLRITAGTYYVDGMLCECGTRPDGTLWRLTDQPMTPRVRRADDPSTARPVNPEPHGRQLVYLDVWERAVGSDEDPTLPDPALGGADTAVRARTSWQVRTRALADGESPDQAIAALSGPRPTMTAQLVPGDTATRRLDNQLYRVQVFQGGDEPLVLWSRDNGNVVARLLSIVDTQLTVDRLGRDDETSLASGDLIELTSTDFELEPAGRYLARITGDPGRSAGAYSFPVTWVSAARPEDLDDLGLCPVVRRWDCPEPVAVGSAPVTAVIDDRFSVTISAAAGARYTAGDYWLVPARTVRLAYGTAGEAGSVEWPTAPDRTPLAQEPTGPQHRFAPLAVVAPADGAGWRVERDCRRLFATTTEIGRPALHLLGGDGQEALPGAVLAEPVRVAVRSGGAPVPGAVVRFTVAAGDLGADDPVPGTTTLTVPMDDTGVAGIRWRLASGADAAPVQVLAAELLDGAAAVRVTGRLSIASQVGWVAPDGCVTFRPDQTVQAALQRLVTTATLRLLGGDGQTVGSAGEIAPHPIRVVVDSPCGPVPGVAVRATPSGTGGVTSSAPGGARPAALPARPRLKAVTDRNGLASFWWQPGDEPAATLTIQIDGSDAAPIVVGATLIPDPPIGLHITAIGFGADDFDAEHVFAADARVPADRLAGGIYVRLDGDADPDSWVGRPVIRIRLDLPWPRAGDGDTWSDQPIGTRPVDLGSNVDAAGPRDVLVWQPTAAAGRWLSEVLWSHLPHTDAVTGRLVIDGWAITATDHPERSLDTHPAGVFEQLFTLVPPPPPQ